MRLFSALVLPEPVRLALLEAQSALRARVPCERWTPPGQFHLTLQFFGDVEEARWQAMAAAYQAVCTTHDALELQVEGLGAFPSVTRPRVLWAGIGGAVSELKQLEAELRRAIATVGVTLDDRPYAPHLTLARGPHAGSEAAAALQEVTYPAVAWRALEVCIFRSTLTPQGAHHELLAAYPLSGASAWPKK